jgi:hypothetical protein
LGEIYLARKSSRGSLRCGFIWLIINGKFLPSCTFSSITLDNGQNKGATGLPEGDSVTRGSVCGLPEPGIFFEKARKQFLPAKVK